MDRINWEKLENHYDNLNSSVNSIDWDEIHAQMAEVSNIDWQNVQRGDYDWQASLDAVVDKVNTHVAAMDEIIAKYQIETREVDQYNWLWLLLMISEYLKLIIR